MADYITDRYEVSVKIGSIPNKLLSIFGLRLIRQADLERRYPVEIAKEDIAAFQYVRANRLSTSSDERLFATVMACRYVVEKGVDGDFVECGVWRGGNSIIAASVFGSMASSKLVWLFDTFAGMTEPTAFDVNFKGESANTKFVRTQAGDHTDWCYSSLDEVKRNFGAAALLTDRVRFVKGDVAHTLLANEQLPDKISVLRLDTDWYASTKQELEVLYPRLSTGGILIIDDYGHWGGARKAVDEYFADRSRPFLQYIDQTARIGIKCA